MKYTQNLNSIHNRWEIFGQIVEKRLFKCRVSYVRLLSEV